MNEAIDGQLFSYLKSNETNFFIFFKRKVTTLGLSYATLAKFLAYVSEFSC